MASLFLVSNGGKDAIRAGDIQRNNPVFFSVGLSVSAMPSLKDRACQIWFGLCAVMIIVSLWTGGFLFPTFKIGLLFGITRHLLVVPAIAAFAYRDVDLDGDRLIILLRCIQGTCIVNFICPKCGVSKRDTETINVGVGGKMLPLHLALWEHRHRLALAQSAESPNFQLPLPLVYD